MAFFSENIRLLAKRFNEIGDNIPMFHDALVEEGFDGLAAHVIGHLTEDHKPWIDQGGCPMAYGIVQDSLNHILRFLEESKLKELRQKMKERGVDE